MTASERAAAEMARREREQAMYGTRPGESVIDATLRRHDPHYGAGFTPADELAIVVDDRAGNEQTISELRDALAAANQEIEFLIKQNSKFIDRIENLECARLSAKEN